MKQFISNVQEMIDVGFELSDIKNIIGHSPTIIEKIYNDYVLLETSE